MLPLFKKVFQSKRFLTQSLSTLGIQLVSVALAFLISFALARLLGSKGYGDYTYAFTWVTVLSLIAIFGFDKLTVKEFAKLKAGQNWSKINSLYRWMTKRILLVSLLIGSGTFLLTVVAGKLFEDATTKAAFQISLIAIPLLALSLHRQAALQGIKEVVIGQLPEKLIRPTVLLLIVGVFFFMDKEKVDAPFAVIASVIAFAVSFLLGQILFLTKTQKTAPEAIVVDEKKHLTKSALSFLAVGSIAVLSSRVDLLMLGILKDTQAVGLYSIPLKFSELLGFILISFNAVLAPIISEYFHSGKTKDLQAISVSAARAVFLLAFPLGLVLIFARHPILAFFGEEFVAGNMVLVILCFGQLFNLAIGSVGYLLLMTGHERFNLICLGISTLLNIILNAVLIPYYGILGAAYATAISIIINNLLMLYFVAKKLKFNPTILGKIPR